MTLPLVITAVNSEIKNVRINYSRSRWLDKQYPSWWERMLEWWRGL